MAKIKNQINTIIFFLCSWLKIKGHGISILVPLHLTEDCGPRVDNWNWLKRYWKHHLPGAEIIIGRDNDAIQNKTPFSKSAAVNDAVRKSHGDILVIIDADVHIPAESILHCAREIRAAIKRDKRLWFMPYRKLFRLTREASRRILNTNPDSPTFPPSPLPDRDFSNKEYFKDTPVSEIGHWYGAMIQIVPREAFDEVGGWDIRFKGWGGEDHAAMVATDTLYSPHKTLPGRVLHFWHPVITLPSALDPFGKKRIWANQDVVNNNNALSGRYYWSRGFPHRMRRLVDEFLRELIIVEEEIIEEIEEIENCDSH